MITLTCGDGDIPPVREYSNNVYNEEEEETLIIKERKTTTTTGDDTKGGGGADDEEPEEEEEDAIEQQRRIVVHVEGRDCHTLMENCKRSGRAESYECQLYKQMCILLALLVGLQNGDSNKKRRNHYKGVCPYFVRHCASDKKRSSESRLFCELQNLNCAGTHPIVDGKSGEMLRFPTDMHLRYNKGNPYLCNCFQKLCHYEKNVLWRNQFCKETNFYCYGAKGEEDHYRISLDKILHIESSSTRRREPADLSKTGGFLQSHRQFLCWYYQHLCKTTKNPVWQAIFCAVAKRICKN